MVHCFQIATGYQHRGYLLGLAVICLFGISLAQATDGLSHDLSSSTHALKGRQLLQGGTFQGGPGQDGGNGGLPIAESGGTGGVGGVPPSLAGGSGNGGAGGTLASAADSGDGGSIKGSGARPNCGFGEYVRSNKCTKCVSKSSTASSEFLRGKKCSKPFGVGSPNACNFGFLSGLQIGKSEDPLRVSTCIDYKRDVVTLYVPRPGFRFFGVRTNSYVFDSISLAGAPLLPRAGIPLTYNYIQRVNGIEVNALVFVGTSKELAKVKGKGIAVNGILKTPGGFDLCFAATAEVCK